MPAYVEGLEELLEMFESIGVKISDKLDPIVKEAAEIVAVDAKEGCPESAEEYVNSRSGKKNPRGYLKNAIGVKRQKKKNKYKVQYAVQALKKDAYYGVFVEYGANGKAGQPYMRPATDKNRERVNNVIARRIKRLIESR